MLFPVLSNLKEMVPRMVIILDHMDCHKEQILVYNSDHQDSRDHMEHYCIFQGVEEDIED